MLRQILGLLLLAGVGIALLAGGIAGAHGWELLALITIGLLFCLGLARLFFSLKGSAASGERAISAHCYCCNCWRCRNLGAEGGLGINPCVASGLVGIVAALALSENVAAAVYAASFVATSSLTELPPALGAVGRGFNRRHLLAHLLRLCRRRRQTGTIAAGAVLATMLIFRALGGCSMSFLQVLITSLAAGLLTRFLTACSGGRCFPQLLLQWRPA